MSKPNLTFFCELEAPALKELFDAINLADLNAMHAGISLGILDLSPERAEVVKRLNEAGVPVTAWLLLSKEQGYWFCMENAPQAVERYESFYQWSDENGLKWEAIGLDIEPDIRELQLWQDNKAAFLLNVLKRLPLRGRLKRAQKIYNSLVEQIRSDGYGVESYQFPFILDERKVHSTLLERAAGLVDIQVDTEVLMLYSSFWRPNGPGYIWSYTPEAQAVGLGSTGGGVELDFLDSKPLTWEELARDLRLAWVNTKNIYIFSLEGCVRQGFLPKLVKFEWDWPIIEPVSMTTVVENWRGALQTALWFSANGLYILTGFLTTLVIILKLLRWNKKRNK